VVRANNTWSANWRPRLRVEVFPSARGPSAFHYYTGRRYRTIASRPTPSGLQLDVDDLEVETALAVYCHPPDAVQSAGRRLSAGRDYTYDHPRRLLEIPLRGAARLAIIGRPGPSGSLSLF
jgi:hypothetical protein